MSGERRRASAMVFVLLAGLVCLCWFAASPQFAEALNGWTIRLLGTTSESYPPGYGEPTPY